MGRYRRKYTKMFKGKEYTEYLDWFEDKSGIPRHILAYRFARPEQYPDPYAEVEKYKNPIRDRFDTIPDIAKRFIYRKERFITRWLKLKWLTEEY